MTFFGNHAFVAAMHDLIAQLERGHDLSPSQAGECVRLLLDEKTGDTPKAALLLALRAKGETAQEIAAFVKALLARAVDPRIDPKNLPGPMLDVCGTGGDRMDLFNISTTGMFVLAAGGAVVVKHGNRGITSKCGGADVLEALGVKIDLPPADLRRCVEATGAGFLFAPNYHPAFKVIAPVRKTLAAQGVATIFNLLGPLLNPAQPAHQLAGVFDRTQLSKYAAVLQLLGRTRSWAVNGSGADEILPCGTTEAVEATPGSLREFTIDPAALGIAPCAPDALRGGTREENARILTGILDGTIRGAKRDVVRLNAAAGFVVAGIARDLPEGITLADEQIDSGRALAKLRAMQDFQ